MYYLLLLFTNILGEKLLLMEPYEIGSHIFKM